MLELELKAKIEDPELMRERILSLGALSTEFVTEHDYYFNAPHKDFCNTDEALRLRSAANSWTLTYKGSKRRDFAFKAREEINVQIEDGEKMRELLLNLGFKISAEVKKDREYFSYENTTISLDNVYSLGYFIEIEVITEGEASEASLKIDKIKEMLGVTGEPILLSYLELLLLKENVT